MPRNMDENVLWVISCQTPCSKHNYSEKHLLEWRGVRQGFFCQFPKTWEPKEITYPLFLNFPSLDVMRLTNWPLTSQVSVLQGRWCPPEQWRRWPRAVSQGDMEGQSIPGGDGARSQDMGVSGALEEEWGGQSWRANGGKNKRWDQGGSEARSRWASKAIVCWFLLRAKWVVCLDREQQNCVWSDFVFSQHPSDLWTENRQEGSKRRNGEAS